MKIPSPPSSEPMLTRRELTTVIIGCIGFVVFTLWVIASSVGLLP
jgi:hypothetical protein